MGNHLYNSQIEGSLLELAIRRQANGGKEPLEIDEPVENLPAEFLRVNITMSLRLWLSLVKDMSEVDQREVYKREMFADHDAIRTRLKQMVPCPACVVGEMNPDGCPVCEGKGLVPATIPGARLLPRGQHVRFV